MNPMDWFNIDKPLTKVYIPSGLSRRRMHDDESFSDKAEELNGTVAEENEKDYVDAYVKEEEQELLKMTSFNIPGSQSRFDDISQGVASNVTEIDSYELTKIYKTYDFSYRPKTKLTITGMKDRIVSMVETNPVTVIQGPTGCGKTTQVPQFILDASFRKKVHCNIIVTQPRRIAAMSIARRVSEERQWPLGTLVGCKVGMINYTSHDTRLTYCTTGVLLHTLINMRHMHNYTHVILDEVHERDQEMDFLMLVVRKLLRTNSRTVKVILMSATFNVTKFSSYFSSPMGSVLSPAPIIDVEKKNFFTVNTFYLCQIGQLGKPPTVSLDEPKVSQEMMKLCINLLIILDKIDKDSEDGEDRKSGEFNRHVVLIFLPGINEIEDMHSILTSSKYESSKWDVVVLHSSITSEEQQRIFEQPMKGHRRVILSTNIAESSITVPDVKYVIDFCLTKRLVTDPRTNFQCLELTWASKANCDQRAGRTGRVMDGRVYRLVPKHFYDNYLDSEGLPEMMRAPLEQLVLQAKLLDMGEPKAILALALDPPDLSNLERTILLLKEIGALLYKQEDMQRFDGELTDLGRVMAHLPVEIHIAKLIALGQVFSILRETIIIGASMATKSMFSAPFQMRLQSYSAKLIWAERSCSDCIAFLHVYNVWMHEKLTRRLNSNTAEKNWAQRNYIQIRVLREVDAMVQDITRRLERLGITETVGANRVVWDEIERPFVLKIAIAGAFYPHYFVRSVQRGQLDERDGIKLLAGHDPANTVYLQGWPMSQPGPLYARHIQKFFDERLSLSMGTTTVTFDGSTRVYVQFGKNHGVGQPSRYSEIPGKVSLSVYKAIKIRQYNIPIVIPVLDPTTATVRAKELNLSPHSYNAFTGDSKYAMKSRAFQPILPGIDVSYIPLNIYCIINPGQFWVRMDDGETSTKAARIKACIESLEETWQVCRKPPAIGSLVIAPLAINHHSAIHARAVVQAHNVQAQEMLIEVLFIDHGNTERLRLCDIRQVDGSNEIFNIPALAFECVLKGVRPSILRNLNGQWTSESVKEFMKLISGKIKLYGKIYSVVNGVTSLELIRLTREDGAEMNINEYLIEKGYAEVNEESYLSRSNHELREQHDVMTPPQRQQYEELQYDQNSVMNHYPPSPDPSECHQKVHLRGPYSPLEMQLVHLAAAGQSKQIHIEWNSVNSVLLDTNPEDTREQLLVAGIVGQSTNGDRLTLRNTTLMPALPGLTAMLSLIFCPQMELRRNSLGTYYTGALCGLGFDPSTGRSLFPEHDMIIPFDVEITIDDLQDVNRLRHWMNMAIHTNVELENCDMDEIAVCQNKIKSALFKLIEKKRTPQEAEVDLEFAKWNRYENLLLHPNQIGVEKSNIFKLHCALELEERNPELEEMIAHMSELRDLVTEDVRKHLREIECRLCKKSVFGIYNLRGHLGSAEHVENEEKFGINVR